ncbi:MAG: sialidase family protein [Actinomycetota bacterium]
MKRGWAKAVVGGVVATVVLIAAVALAHHATPPRPETAASGPAGSGSALPDCAGSVGGDEEYQPGSELASPNASPDVKFCEERQAMQYQQRARAKAERDIHRTGLAVLTAVKTTPAGGWAGEQPFSKQDDWEPDIAADPTSPHVYAITTEFGNRACSKCPEPAFVYKVSSDHGQTWGAPHYLCRCRGDVPGSHWQYDPTMAVADDGTVYATVLSRWHTYVTTSSDHGQTWSPMVDVAPDLSWTDHGQITISPDGQDVYVAFNHADSYVAASHDGGASFAPPVKTNTDTKYYWYHYKGSVLSDGTAVITATAVSRSPYDVRLTRYYALRSTDGGLTWQTIQVGRAVPEQPSCYTDGCRHDHWGGLSRLSADGNGDLAYAYVGPKVARKGQETYVSLSSDGGQTWSSPSQLSPTFTPGGRRVVAVFPQITGVGSSGFSLWWMDDRDGRGRFNVWSRSSSDDGATWSQAVDISDAVGGARYISPKGFLGDYGDYGGIATMNNGNVIAAWGEGFGYAGPGNTWINRQT